MTEKGKIIQHIQQNVCFIRALASSDPCMYKDKCHDAFLPVGYASLTYALLWIQSEAKGMMNKAGYKTKQKHFPAPDEHNLNSRGQHKYRFQDAIS